MARHIASLLLAAATCALFSSGCVHRNRGLARAAEGVPEARTFALEHVPDLSPAERDVIRTQEPRLGHANYAVYYFWWLDESGEPFVGVEGFDPNRPFRAYRCDASPR